MAPCAIPDAFRLRDGRGHTGAQSAAKPSLIDRENRVVWEATRARYEACAIDSGVAVALIESNSPEPRGGSYSPSLMKARSPILPIPV